MASKEDSYEGANLFKRQQEGGTKTSQLDLQLAFVFDKTFSTFLFFPCPSPPLERAGGRSVQRRRQVLSAPSKILTWNFCTIFNSVKYLFLTSCFSDFTLKKVNSFVGSRSLTCSWLYFGGWRCKKRENLAWMVENLLLLLFCLNGHWALY